MESREVNEDEKMDDAKEEPMEPETITDAEPDAQTVPETSEWKDKDAIRYLELYFSLCSKHHDFLDEYVYLSAPSFIS